MARAATDQDAESAIELVLQGDSIYMAAIKIGCHYSSLCGLLRSDAYSARAIEARQLSADAQEALAFKALRDIPDGADKAVVARQIALSQRHARAAATRDPHIHGDRVEVANTGNITVLVNRQINQLTDDSKTIDITPDDS